MNLNNLKRPGKISLLLSDVDGTLVTNEKVLTPRVIKAVRSLQEAGIKFSIVSARSPLGLVSLIDQLHITSPVGAFNGAIFALPNLTVIQQLLLPDVVSQAIVARILKHGLDVWIFSGDEWFISRDDGLHVKREISIAQKAPLIIQDCLNIQDLSIKSIAQIRGVSDDYAALEQCERNLQKLFGSRISANRSHPFFLDVTHPKADKGIIVNLLANYFSIDVSEIATIGDMFNDVSMFKRSGVSIAMGNATVEVQTLASHITDTNENEGFAKAIERFIL